MTPTRTCPVCDSDVDAAATTCPVCDADVPEASTTPRLDPVEPIHESSPADDPLDAGSDPLEAPQEATSADAAPGTAIDTGPWSEAGRADVPTSERPGSTGGGFASPPPPPPPPPGAGWAGPSAPPPPTGPTYPQSGGPPRPPAFDPTHPSGLSSSVRSWGVLTHLSAFVGAIFLVAFVGPLVMWLIRREEHPFLDHHGKEAVNFNLSMLLYGVLAVVISVLTIGIGLIVVVPLGIALFLTWLIAPIVAAVKASNGEGFRYPVTIRFIKD